MSSLTALFPSTRPSTQPPASPSTDSQSSLPPQRTRLSYVQEWKKAFLKDVTYKTFKLASRWSSLTTPAWSGYASGDFMLGAGMVIIQPATGKVVVCHDTKTKSYFLPKGRKDVNESLEDTAVREASEEVRANYQSLQFPV